MKTLALYQIADNYIADLAKLAELDLDDQTLADTLEGLGGELQEKATNVAAFARNLEASAAAIKEAEAQMAARRKALEGRAKRIREYLLAQMQRTGIAKVESPWFTVAVRANPPSVVIDAESQIPAAYWRVPDPPPPILDKDGIKRALKAGQTVPGVHVESTFRVDIK